MKIKYTPYWRVFKSIIFALSFFVIISCTKEKKIDLSANYLRVISDSNINSTDTGLITYLALGDSYTIGQSVEELERFPVQLVNILRLQNVNISKPEIVAVTGWTTGNLLNALNASPPKNNYSFVTLLIGVNNQYQGRSLDEYKIQFAELLKRAIYYAGNNINDVFVLSIPDYSVTPFARGFDAQKIAKEIDQFNDANKAISSDFGVRYVNITPISREAKSDPGLIASDGLHPSGKQYLKWDEILAPLILDELGH